MKLDFALLAGSIPSSQRLGFNALKESKMARVLKEDFLNRVNLSDLFSIHSEISMLDIHKADFYEINNGFSIAGMITIDFEAIFTKDGVIPIFPSSKTINLASQKNQNYAWLLDPASSCQDVVRLQTGRYCCFECGDGSIRLQAMVSGKAVAGMHIKDRSIKSFFEKDGFKFKRNNLVILAAKMGVLDLSADQTLGKWP